MFQDTYSIQGETGRTGVLQFNGVPTFADIFDGVPQYYPGSSIEVQETLRIFTNITNPDVIDVDFNWFAPKKYLGSWQILEPFGFFGWDESKFGFLNSTLQDITYRSRYTVVADPSTPIAQGEQLEISACNFFLKPDVYLFPGEINPVTGFNTYDKFPHFTGKTTLSAAPLKDTDYYQFIGGVGLYLNPGVEGVRIEYRIAVINDIYTDYPTAVAPTCEFQSATCQEQFTAYILQGNNRFTSQATCALNYVACYPYTWVCPDDSNVTFPYWLGIAI
jgi:hypothetical protein